MSNEIDICKKAYEVLLSTQNEEGEFGKRSASLIQKENELRHPKTELPSNMFIQKPNCSITLISALGICCYTSINDPSVIKAREWFTQSNYFRHGWFHQKINVVDINPLGNSYLQSTSVMDVRHTATALLASLYFKAPSYCVIDSLRNLLHENCKDKQNKGWKATVNDEEEDYDFYATLYMLASLDYLKNTSTYINYGLDFLKLNQLISNGLNAICSKNPEQLGYDPSLEQTLRTNSTLLFFLAPLLKSVYPDYFNRSIQFIINKVQINNDMAYWGNENFDMTINILAGLNRALYYSDQKQKENLVELILKVKKFILNKFDNFKVYHPVSLGFILYLFGNTKNSNNVENNLFMNEQEKKLPEINIDVLMIVATKAEEKAITNYDDFEEIELNNKINILFRNKDGISIALARGFEYGEVDAALITQSILSELNPKVIAMAGFCAGQRGKQILGDVVIAEKVFNYDHGKQISENEFSHQISSYSLDGRIKQKVERFKDNWREDIKVELPKDFQLQCFEFLKKLKDNKGIAKPIELYDQKQFPNWKDIIKNLQTENLIETVNNNESIKLTNEGLIYLNNLLLFSPEGLSSKSPSTKLGVLATGTRVQEWDGIFEFLNSKFDRKCSVLDMEGHAMAKVAQYNNRPFIIAKGVGDFAQNGKKFDNRFLDYAVYSSYCFLKSFLKEFINNI